MTQSRRNRWIMGSAISLAALAVAIDHTRHPVPQAVVTPSTTQDVDQGGSPCSLGNDTDDSSVSPCSLD